MSAIDNSGDCFLGCGTDSALGLVLFGWIIRVSDMASGRMWGLRRCGSGIFDELSEVLGCRGEEDFISGAGEASEPEAVELEDAFHMGEGHFDLLSLAA